MVMSKNGKWIFIVTSLIVLPIFHEDTKNIDRLNTDLRLIYLV
jgi:hypothetical protein